MQQFFFSSCPTKNDAPLRKHDHMGLFATVGDLARCNGRHSCDSSDEARQGRKAGEEVGWSGRGKKGAVRESFIPLLPTVQQRLRCFPACVCSLFVLTEQLTI